MQLVKPKHLNIGDTIGVISPAFPVVLEHTKTENPYYDKGIKELQNMGFKIKEGNNLRKRKWWSGGTVEERVSDLMDMYTDKNVKAIISQNGGQTCMDLLDKIDYEIVKNNPKPLFGFSDITNLLIAIFTKTNQVGFHSSLSTYNYGWMWADFIYDKKNLEKEVFLKTITTTEPLGIIKPASDWKSYKNGKAEGFLFGGNLSMLNFLIGTQYFPKNSDLQGAVLFWEIDSVKSYRIYKTLLQFKYHGLFDVISGMVVGRNADISGSSYDGYDEPTEEDIIKEVLKDYKFPILANVDFGHKGLNFPMPIGIKVRVDSDNKILEFLEPAVV